MSYRSITKSIAPTKREQNVARKILRRILKGNKYNKEIIKNVYVSRKSINPNARTTYQIELTEIDNLGINFIELSKFFIVLRIYKSFKGTIKIQIYPRFKEEFLVK